MSAVARVAVIGGGQIGGGVADICANAGLSTVLIDHDADALTAARNRIEGRLDRRLAREEIAADLRAAVVGRLAYHAELAAVDGADLVIEAITEDEEAKRALFRALSPHLGAETFIATNTSSISITRLAAVSGRPERFMGLHFMNPPARMQLVELIRGIATIEETFTALRGFVEALGKTPVAAEDFPAFIVNRVLLPMINEAVYALYEGVGTVEAIDNGLKLGANHPMGPLELADFIGLDTCLSIMQVLYEGLADGKYRPCPLLVKYVEAGWLGRKVGRGFYDYAQDPPRPTR